MVYKSLKLVNAKVISADPTSFGFYSEDGKEELFNFDKPYALDKTEAKTEDIQTVVEKQLVSGYKLT